jgi:hypothetical protein
MKVGVNMTLATILGLYLAFRVKQVLCDFFMQTSWMAYTKGKPLKEGGAKALFSHTAIHAVFTLLVVLLFAPKFWWLAFVDFVAHSVIDKGKAEIINRMEWSAKDYTYWWAFGVDQEMHNLTHLAFIILIVLDSGAKF